MSARKVDYSSLPLHMQDGARAYVEHGQPPGDFLAAVLANDLVEAYSRADSENTLAMRRWAGWLYEEAPRGCWGSTEKVKAWIYWRECERAAGGGQ